MTNRGLGRHERARKRQNKAGVARVHGVMTMASHGGKRNWMIDGLLSVALLCVAFIVSYNSRTLHAVQQQTLNSEHAACFFLFRFWFVVLLF